MRAVAAGRGQRASDELALERGEERVIDALSIHGGLQNKPDWWVGPGGLERQARVDGQPRVSTAVHIDACLCADYLAAMETLRVILNLLGFVALGWLATAVLWWLMGRVIPWPYPRHWRWGWATLDGADGVSEPVEPRRAGIDWLDHNLRRN